VAHLAAPGVEGRGNENCCDRTSGGPTRQAIGATAAHEKRGLEVGLPAATVEAIVAGLPASFPDAREQAVYEVAMALCAGRLVPQGLYAVPAVSPGLAR
jgi:hypothetical protein